MSVRRFLTPLTLIVTLAVVLASTLIITKPAKAAYRPPVNGCEITALLNQPLSWVNFHPENGQYWAGTFRTSTRCNPVGMIRYHSLGHRFDSSACVSVWVTTLNDAWQEVRTFGPKVLCGGDVGDMARVPVNTRFWLKTRSVNAVDRNVATWPVGAISH